jgi:spectinomycin phosphotransferase
MLIKPDLKDQEIIACLRDAYGLNVEKISFLANGAIKRAYQSDKMREIL